jgi:hypothetical protein
MKVRIELEVDWDEYNDADKLARHIIKAMQPDMGQFWSVVRAGSELDGGPVSVDLLQAKEL